MSIAIGDIIKFRFDDYEVVSAIITGIDFKDKQKLDKKGFIKFIYWNEEDELWHESTTSIAGSFDDGRIIYQKHCLTSMLGIV